MSQREYLSWVRFYRLFPFDDLHRFHRPAALIASADATDRNKAVNGAIDWLQPDPRNAEMNDADMNTLRAFGYRAKGA